MPNRCSCPTSETQPQHPSPSQLRLHPARLSNRTPQFPWQLTHVVSVLEAKGGSVEGQLMGGPRHSWEVRAESHPPSLQSSLFQHSASPPGPSAEAPQSPQEMKRWGSRTKAARSVSQNVSLSCRVLCHGRGP